MTLQEYRESLGLSQEELAELAEVHRMTVVRLEAGLHRPTPATLKRLARALRISRAELVTMLKENGSGRAEP